jgi:hypothetical protein
MLFGPLGSAPLGTAEGAAPGGPAAQNLSPPLVAEADGFFGATLTPGEVSLAVPLVAEADGFFAHEVVLAGGAVSLSPPLVSGADGFFGPAVAAGQVTLIVPFLTDADGFFSATVAPGAVTLFPGFLTESDMIWSPAVTFGGPVSSARGAYPGDPASGGTVGPSLRSGILSNSRQSGTIIEA